VRITILTVGSRGDVQPFIALGIGLRAAGVDVTLATHAEWAAWIHAAGLRFARVEGAPHRFMYEEQGQRWISAGAKPLHFLRSVFPVMRRLLREQLGDALSACRDADALLFTPLGMAGYHMAEKLGLPCCGASLQPVSPTRCFPSPVLNPGFSFGPYNLLSHMLVDRGYAEVWRGEINRWRRERLDLAPLPHGFTYSRFGCEELPLLYGFSPAVVPRPHDWSARLHVTGYWFLDTPVDWKPPEALADFLQAGAPPVYFGFGSMVVRDAAAVSRLVQKAADRAGQRVILAVGRGAVSGRKLSHGAFAIDEAPHDWLFPRTAAVVHHGGAGTTAAGLRAGVPSVVVPLVGDQLFWGARVHALGAGPNPIPFTRLSVERLAASIEQCVTDSGLRERAAAIGRRIRSEDGVARAVDSLAGIFGFAPSSRG
jgi:sterol 3beta-glucosyltransferase